MVHIFFIWWNFLYSDICMDEKDNSWFSPVKKKRVLN